MNTIPPTPIIIPKKDISQGARKYVKSLLHEKKNYVKVLLELNAPEV